MPIALLTDFGTSDHYVAAMKGVILTIAPTAVIVDITHEIEPQNISSAAFVLQACFRDFPPGTVFVCVVDPGVGSSRRAIIVEAYERIFIGPDNGLFSFVLSGSAAVHSIENERFFRQPVSRTFHGRDIFAPVAAHLIGGTALREFGSAIDDPVIIADTKATSSEQGELAGRVLHIDRFGNVVTSITAEEGTAAVQFEIGDRSITERRSAYAEAGTEKVFAIVGSAGFIEFSVNGGSAAAELRASVGMPVIARRH